MQMIQVELQHPTEAGHTVMVTWIPRELRTKQGDQITAGNDPRIWTIVEQYTIPLDSMGINHDWKAGGLAGRRH